MIRRDISNRIELDFFTVIQRNGTPLPLPIRVCKGFLDRGLTMLLRINKNRSLKRDRLLTRLRLTFFLAYE
jgi:hypothetical protein